MQESTSDLPERVLNLECHVAVLRQDADLVLEAVDVLQRQVAELTSHDDTLLTLIEGLCVTDMKITGILEKIAGVAR